MGCNVVGILYGYIRMVVLFLEFFDVEVLVESVKDVFLYFFSNGEIYCIFFF